MVLNDIKRYCYRRFKTSFSKSGEDIQIAQLLNKVDKGFYVDVGSHHPVKGSNTYFFYLRGWRGVCIEPNPAFAKDYAKLRSKDYFFNGGIGINPSNTTYYHFKEDARNTFSKDYIESFGLKNEIIKTTNIQVLPLKQVLESYIPKNHSIDFMNIDVEGSELEVVEGNHWYEYRPKYVMVESHRTLQEDLDSQLVSFMQHQHYNLIGKTKQGQSVGTLLFQDLEFIRD